MEFELITATCVFSPLSKSTFLELLSSAIKISDDFNTHVTVDAFTCRYRRYWRFNNLDMDFIACANSLEEIESLVKEIKNDKEGTFSI